MPVILVYIIYPGDNYEAIILNATEIKEKPELEAVKFRRLVLFIFSFSSDNRAYRFEKRDI